MEHFAGLDASMKATSICVCDAEGAVIAAAEVPTDPAQIAQYLAPWRRTLRRVGHEAGALSPWLQSDGERSGVAEKRRIRRAR